MRQQEPPYATTHKDPGAGPDPVVVTRSNAWRYLWILALIGLPALAWFGALDRASSADINGSIASAGLIYGTARGINALVSVLQGTELNVVFVTIGIGEVLDPVNDLIERFSEVILVALASLALQKILLAIVSHGIFNVLLSLVAIATVVSIWLQSERLNSALLRIFLVIVFFRFSLGLVVLANSWVDASFLQEADQQRHLAMEKFQGELRQIDTLSREEDEAEQLLVELKSELASNERSRRLSKKSLQALDAEIAANATQLEALRNAAGVLCGLSGLSPTCPENIKQAQRELQGLRAERASEQELSSALESAMEDMRERMDCLEKRQRGEDCTFWDGLPDAPNTAQLRQKLQSINASLSDFAENCINLLVSLLLKTVAIPFLFVYLLLKIVKVTWRRI